MDKKGKETKHFSPEENSVLVHVKEEVDRVLPMRNLPKGYTPNAVVQYGFAISKSKLR